MSKLILNLSPLDRTLARMVWCAHFDQDPGREFDVAETIRAALPMALLIREAATEPTLEPITFAEAAITMALDRSLYRYLYATPTSIDDFELDFDPLAAPPNPFSDN